MRAALSILSALALTGAAAAEPAYVLVPDRVFDGENMRAGWKVRVENGRIVAAGPTVDETGAERVMLDGATLTPGLIDLHSHIFLHPYDETDWNDQVLRESLAERTARAANHLRATLTAGFTTLRETGTEGAGYADVGMKEALAKGVVPGPRLLAAGPAMVATAAYGPKGFHEGVAPPQGAVEVSGRDGVVEETRRQIGGGADWVKVYADYRWGPDGEPRPTFSEEELRLIVETAAASGRKTMAHAASDEGMRRAVAAGVATIEHGDEGSLETYRLMARRGVAICPTLGAVEAVTRYDGWDGSDATRPPLVEAKRTQMRRALEAGATICNGSDVGVFDHGDNAWELELLVAYGMTPLAAMRAATSVNARIIGMDDEIGRIAPGMVADLAAFGGDPSAEISRLRDVRFVMQQGAIIRRP